jgi:hypothetical protein
MPLRDRVGAGSRREGSPRANGSRSPSGGGKVMIPPLAWCAERDVAGSGHPPVGFGHQGYIPGIVVR